MLKLSARMHFKAFGQPARYRSAIVTVILDMNDDPLSDSSFSSGAEGKIITCRVQKHEIPLPRHNELLIVSEKKYKIIQVLPDGSADFGDIWQLTLTEA